MFSTASRLRLFKTLFAALFLLLSTVASPPQTVAAQSGRPLVGAIRWDSWFPTNQTPPSYFVHRSLFNKYSHRIPFYGWSNGGINNQTEINIMEREIAYAADSKLDYWAFVWYPEDDSSVPESKIMEPFNHYLASPNKGRVPYAFVLQTYWMQAKGQSTFENVYVPYFIQRFQDANYIKMSGNRPLIYLFVSNGNDPNYVARVNYLRTAVTNAGFGTPYIVENTGNGSAAVAVSADARSWYGDGQQKPGNGHQCWSAQVSTDSGNFGPHGSFKSVISLTPMNDPRPRDEPDLPGDPIYPFGPYGFWVDQPTYSQWEAHLQSGVNWISTHPSNIPNPPLVLIYAWNEIDEGGPGIVPTIQENTRYLDAIKAVNTGRYPSNFIDTLNGNNCAFTYSGAWTDYAPAAGAHDNDEHISNSTGAYGQISWVGTGFQLLGTRGPNRGKLEIFLDGVSQGIYDQYASTWQLKSVLYNVSGLTPGNHTLRVVVTGQKNANSSDTQVGIDAVRVPVVRSGQVWSADDYDTGTGLNQWNYVGSGWQYNNICPECYQNTGHWNSNTSAYATVAFNGTQVVLYGVVDTMHGKGAVSIDGGAETVIDFAAPLRAGNVQMWTSPVLPAGNHTFRIRPHTGSPVVDRLEIISGGGTTTSFATGVTANGVLRNNYGGFVGTKITTGSAPVTVTDLGRYFISGNNGTHTVKIVTTSGVDVASVAVNMAAGSADSLGFKYGTLTTAVTLSANTSYYLVSLEANGGDQWRDNVNTTLTTTGVASIPKSVYQNGATWVENGGAGNSYVPLNFKYSN